MDLAAPEMKKARKQKKAQDPFGLYRMYDWAKKNWHKMTAHRRMRAQEKNKENEIFECIKFLFQATLNLSFLNKS